MTAQPLIADLPLWLDLGGQFVVRLTAVDPATGSTVSGVKISTATITGAPVGSSTVEDLPSGEWVIVPGPD